MTQTVSPKKGRLVDTPDKSGWFSNCSRGQHDKCKNQNLNKHGKSCEKHCSLVCTSCWDKKHENIPKNTGKLVTMCECECRGKTKSCKLCNGTNMRVCLE